MNSGWFDLVQDFSRTTYQPTCAIGGACTCPATSDQICCPRFLQIVDVNGTKGGQMLYAKACPRCSGDIKLDRDNYGVHAKCLQCGFNKDFTTRKSTGSPMTGESGHLADPGAVPPDIEEREAA
jgi:hypothetical protein